MRFGRKIGARLLPPLGYALMRFYWYTSPKRFHIRSPLPTGQSVVVCWHEELMISPQAYRKYRPDRPASGIISQHFDGEIIARILGFFGIRGLRGSTYRGANKVLLEAFRALKRGDDLLVTPDGPRGPRHEIGDGAIALAMKANLPILAVNYMPRRYWRASSWDKFLIPKPFTTLDIHLRVVTLEDTTSMDEAKRKLYKAMTAHLSETKDDET